MPIRTALVADDCSLTREIHADLLRGQGFAVTAVDSGSAAAHAVRSVVEAHGRPFDLTLLDFDMPGGDGPAAARAIAESSAGLESGPLVCVTSHEPECVEALCRAAGFDAVVRKPLRIVELAPLLEMRRSR